MFINATFLRLLNSLLICCFALAPALAQAASPPDSSIKLPGLPIVNQHEGFRLEIPSDWTVLNLSDTAVAVGAALASETNPQLQSLLSNPSFQQMMAAGMKFYAIDLTDAGLEHFLPPNVNVMKLEVGVDLPLDVLKRTNERQLRALADPNYPVKSAVITHQGREALAFEYVSTYSFGSDLSQPTQINQLLYTEGGIQYIITIGVPLIAADSYRAVVSQILDSFQLMAGQGPSTNGAGNLLPATPITPTITPIPAPQVVAVIQSNQLNVRVGPSTGYRIISHVQRDDRLPAIGRNRDCSWTQVTLPNGTTGWTAAQSPYATLEGDCMALPVITVAPPPPPANPNGCILLENFFNDEANVTITSKDGRWNKNFKIGRNARHTECLAAGEYTYTIDIPPPWGGISGEWTIVQGRTLTFPIYGKHN